MPQDQLWATSARLTGWQMRYAFDIREQGNDQLSITPMWSKIPPASRDGAVICELPSFMRWHVTRVTDAAIHQILGGVASSLPGVVRAELRQIQDAFQEGSLQ